MDDVPEMVERVAKEIAFADGEDFYEDAKRFRMLASAAIKAMREPTDAMIYASWVDRLMSYENTREVAQSLAAERLENQVLRWQDQSSHRSMIDAALASPTKE